MNLYDNVDPTDFYSALPADYRESGKPLLIFVTTNEPEAAERLAALDTSLFGDENVLIGARLFRAVRIKGDKLSKDHPHWPTLGGKSLPRVVVVDAAGRKAGALDDKDLSPSNLFKTMRKAAAKTFKTDLEKVVKEVRPLLDEMDRVEAKLALLAEKEKDAKGGKVQEIAAEKEKLAKELEDAKARHAALLEKADSERKVTKA